MLVICWRPYHTGIVPAKYPCVPGILVGKSFMAYQT